MLFRIQPNMPARAYQTYAYSRGRDVMRKAACQEVGCQAYAHGWETTVDESTEMGRAQAHYIRAQSGRTFRESRTDGGLTVFRFEPYQRCFADHQTIAEAFYVRGGDWRENRGMIRRHANGRDWAEDMAEQLDTIRTAQERG